MNKIRALIVDDELAGRVNLRYALAEHPAWQIVAECANTSSAREVLAAQPVEVIFLDVQMPKESGLGLARSLCQQTEPPLVIFVTAYHAFAIEAFEVHALDYLLKPFDDERLASTLTRASSLLTQRRAYGAAMRAYVAASSPREIATTPPQYWQQVSVRSIGQIECIALSQVRWISSAGNYVELHLPQRRVLYRQALAKLEAHLDPQEFIRVHRSNIVRRSEIASLTVVGDGSYLLRLQSGDNVNVSERYVQALRKLLREA